MVGAPTAELQEWLDQAGCYCHDISTETFFEMMRVVDIAIPYFRERAAGQPEALRQLNRIEHNILELREILAGLRMGVLK
jgi:hypothetical protein